MAADRNNAFDFVKGCCVIGMIIHHTIDYYSPGNPVGVFVRFITGSFVFLSGFIVASVYRVKYDLNSLNRKLGGRLVIRGFKLLMLFTFLNIAIGTLIKRTVTPGNITIPNILDILSRVYLAGDFRIVAFELLVPIAYVSVVLGLLLTVFHQFRRPLLGATPVLVVACSILFIRQAGGYNLRFLTIGLVGAAFGLLPMESIKRMGRHQLVVIFAAVVQNVIIATVPLYYPVYLMTIIVNIMFLYALGIVFADNTIIGRELNLLGRYSLVGYLAQIAFLQVLSRVFMPGTFGTGGVVLAGMITLLLTIVTVRTLDELTGRYDIARALYRFIFA